MFCKFLKISPLENYLEKLDVFDAFLTSAERKREIQFECNAEKMTNTVRKVNFITGMSVIGLEVVMITLYLTGYFGSERGFSPCYTFMFYQSAVLTYVSIVMNMFSMFYALTLRLELFTSFVQQISDFKWKNTEEQYNQRRMRLNRWGASERYFAGYTRKRIISLGTNTYV